jgi:hypothetical protein
VRYVIAIPAFLACLFYVYVLVQLRRDEKHYKSPGSPQQAIGRGKEKLLSFTAVRPLGSSFAQWSRLAKKAKPQAQPQLREQKRSKAPNSADRMHRSVTYIEIGLPLASGVAPIASGYDDNCPGFSPKKIA